MNHQPKDALDREIDEVLASIAAQEPRRVNAASVRLAMGARRAAPLPAWFAAAAVLLVAFGVWMQGRSVAPTPPAFVARSITRSQAMKAQPSPASELLERASTVFTASSRATSSAIKKPVEPTYEGLPRIVVATLEKPEPLTTPTLAAGALAIPPIDIPALSVPTLSNGPEQSQEKPQP